MRAGLIVIFHVTEQQVTEVALAEREAMQFVSAANSGIETPVCAEN